ncbi:MAG: hypothetical protein M1831_003281 [Alyxoria varia]|nr:MAG: hypothetical protein M1831_003281 [Alyxoria varia]
MAFHSSHFSSRATSRAMRQVSPYVSDSEEAEADFEAQESSLDISSEDVSSLDAEHESSLQLSEYIPHEQGPTEDTFNNHGPNSSTTTHYTSNRVTNSEDTSNQRTHSISLVGHRGRTRATNRSIPHPPAEVSRETISSILVAAEIVYGDEIKALKDQNKELKSEVARLKETNVRLTCKATERGFRAVNEMVKGKMLRKKLEKERQKNAELQKMLLIERGGRKKRFRQEDAQQAEQEGKLTIVKVRGHALR